MNMTEFFEKFERPKSENRTAFIAALFVTQATVIAIKQRHAEHKADPSLPPETIEAIRPHQAAALAQHLVSRAEQLHKLAEHDCNHGLSEAQERREEKLRGEVVEIASVGGFGVEFQGDPRGCVVRLTDPTNEQNGDYTGGGWGVYR